MVQNVCYCFVIGCCRKRFDKSKQKDQHLYYCEKKDFRNTNVSKSREVAIPRHERCLWVQCLIVARYSVPASICVTRFIFGFEGVATGTGAVQSEAGCVGFVRNIAFSI
jgi:hypothetical protein